MVITSQEPWTADGLVLNTYAHNISTHTGRSGLPPIRGENEPVPLRGGRRWVQKVWDEKDLILSMWVNGVDDDGNVPTTYSDRAQFNENLARLKRVFGKRTGLIELSREVLMPEGPLTQTSHVECIDTMEPTTSNRGTLGVFTATLKMPDPFWYGELETVELDSTGATIDNPGDTVAEKMLIELNGPLDNPMVKNEDMGISLRYHGTILDGVTVVIDTSEFTAVDSNTVNRVGRLSNVGSLWWMNIDRGEQAFTLTNWQGGSVGSGNAILKYYPPYL